MKKTLIFLTVLQLLALPAWAQTQCGPSSQIQCGPSALTQRVKEITIQLEGEQESFLVQEYRQEGQFSLWYDAKSFVPRQREDGLRMELLNNLLGSPVYLEVQKVFAQADGAENPLDGFLTQYQADGWQVQPAVTKDALPGFQDPGQTVAGFSARKGTQVQQVYLTFVAQEAYVCTLSYPLMASEGWGARMWYMMNTLEP